VSRKREHVVNENFEYIGKNDRKRVGRRVRKALNGTSGPLNVYIGTCPDYGNDGTNYTFNGIGEEVPLLTRQQIEANKPIFKRLESFWRPIQVLYDASRYRSKRRLLCREVL
jgi:hypothetical protein